MDPQLYKVKSEVYDICKLTMKDLELETESRKYNACRFELNGLKIISRNGKVTPKKSGQFVTFWKRKKNGPITPFDESDQLDVYAINVNNETEFGQFVFPKSLLIQKGILSTTKKDGKRGFRVYPSWDSATNKQALKTQEWQLSYFYKIETPLDIKKVMVLYSKNKLKQ